MVAPLTRLNSSPNMEAFLPSLSSMIGSLNRFWSLLVVFWLTLQPTAAQLCTFWDSSCVDPLAQTAVPVDFQPLILQDISLYYAYDADFRGKGQEPMTKASFWLTWNNPRVDKSVIDANRTSEIAMRVGNLTGTPGGSNNGCDTVWGSACSNDLKDRLRQEIYRLSVKGDYYSQPLETVLNQMLVTNPHLSNCPPQLFDVSMIPVEVFAQETMPDQSASLRRSGSVDDPFDTWFVDNMTAKQQADQVAVAILSRAPAYDSDPPSSEKDIQIELACIQAPSGGSSSSS